MKEFDEDFYVYEEGNGDSWSGFFSSKPDFKKKIRLIGHLMRALRKYFVLREETLDYTEAILNLSEEAGIFMHHDSITGTAKRYVDEDYMNRMS